MLKLRHPNSLLSALIHPDQTHSLLRSAVGSGMNFQGNAGHAFDFAMGHMFRGKSFIFWRDIRSSGWVELNEWQEI
jgi:hypothetical protein